MSINSLRNTANWALMVALVLGAGAIAQAQNADEAKGKVIQIGRTDGSQTQPNLPPPNDDEDGTTFAPPAQAPEYWIGLLGGSITPDNPLRAQLDLPEDQGLIVENVVPNSPAAKAGLKQHDILLKANDKDLHEMQDLVELVLTEGPNKGQIKLDVLRHNKHETVQLTPEERPANMPLPQIGLNNGTSVNGGGLVGGLSDDEAARLRGLMQQFGGGANRGNMPMPFQFRNFGNGVIVGGGAGGGAVSVPNGVSITIQKENDKPANITVKRGEETWNVVGDDPASLKQLPEDLRPAVEQMLRGNGGMHINMPNFERQQNGQGIDDPRFRDRLERMEQRLEEMQKRLSGGQQPAAENSTDQNQEQK